MANSRLSWLEQLVEILEAPVPGSRLREYETAMAEIVREHAPQLLDCAWLGQSGNQLAIEAETDGEGF